MSDLTSNRNPTDIRATRRGGIPSSIPTTGTVDHARLKNRDPVDAHPQYALSGHTHADEEVATTTAAAASSGVPPGAMSAYGGSTAPAGWLLCDGSAVSRTTHADLYAAIGDTYGAGDGSTTFNLPDLRQRVPLGKAASGTGSTLGGTGGSKDLIVVSHTHSPGTLATSDPGNHDHAVGGDTGNRLYITGSGLQFMVTNADFNASQEFTGPVSVDVAGAHTHTLSGATASAGASGTDANLPPYAVVNWIVKT